MLFMRSFSTARRRRRLLGAFWWREKNPLNPPPSKLKKVAEGGIESVIHGYLDTTTLLSSSFEDKAPGFKHVKSVLKLFETLKNVVW